jgi:hypothetical protein
MMNRVLTALLIALAALLAGSPAVSAAPARMDVAIGDRAVVDRSGAATVPVTVTCSFESPGEQTSGTLTVTVTQSAKSGDTTGTGTVPITCDGQTRTYTVTVTPTSGSFRPGVLVTHAQGDARALHSEQVCADHPDGTQECGTYSHTEVLSGADGPEEVRAVGSGR